MMLFFYIQGTLDESGDELRSVNNKNLDLEVRKVYRNTIISLKLMLSFFFIVKFMVGLQFVAMGESGEAGGTEMLNNLSIILFIEFDAITLGIIVSSISFTFFKDRVQQRTTMYQKTPLTQQKFFCTQCIAPTIRGNKFCISCGKQF